jgi:ribosomal protein S10
MKKVEYVREHYSKEVRKEIAEKRESKKRMKASSFQRKKQRMWTLNRSPHGNKTAREQFGRQVWQRRRQRTEEKKGWDRRKEVVYKEHQYVSRKEISYRNLDHTE